MPITSEQQMQALDDSAPRQKSDPRDEEIRRLREKLDKAHTTINNLRGTLRYIAAQSQQNYDGLLAVICANAEAALHDSHKTIRSFLGGQR